MSPNKGIEVRGVEREFVRLGGAVDRSSPDHVKFMFPGLPCVGVHCNRTRAPRRLVSMLRKMQAGKVVTQPRAPILEEPVAPEPEPEKVVQHPNPPRPFSVGGTVDIDVIKSAAADLEQRKARDRAAARAHLFARPAPTPYVAQEPPLAFRKEVRYHDIRDPYFGSDEGGRDFRAMFKDAERGGMAWWFSDVFEWLEEMEPWLAPQQHKALPSEGFRRYGIAVIRPRYGLMHHHTYVFSLDNTNDEVGALLTVDPATFARFKVSWERGTDHVRARCRALGIAE